MLLRKSLVVQKTFSRSLCTEPATAFFRTPESDPRNHGPSHIGRFYTMPDSIKKTVFTHGGFPREFQKQTKTFAECCVMVREPALEIMNYIKRTNFNRPVIRYVLYGDRGAGKSLILAHLLHFGHLSGFILVHVPWAPEWYKRPKEFRCTNKFRIPATSESEVDLPLDAAAWLIHFKSQNVELLKNPELTVSKEYEWSKREITPKGAHLLELIDHGVNRMKFATQVVSTLLDELKRLSTEGKCRVMVAIDGYNIMWQPLTKLIGERRVRIRTDQITLTHPFRKITSYDWTNGVVLLTVGTYAAYLEGRESNLPQYLLGKPGWEHLDPFVPVRVDKYSEKEARSCIDYYVNRRWIQNTTSGFDTEIEALSGRNPFQMMKICAPL